MLLPSTSGQLPVYYDGTIGSWLFLPSGKLLSLGSFIMRSSSSFEAQGEVNLPRAASHYYQAFFPALFWVKLSYTHTAVGPHFFIIIIIFRNYSCRLLTSCTGTLVSCDPDNQRADDGDGQEEGSQVTPRLYPHQVKHFLKLNISRIINIF